MSEDNANNKEAPEKESPEKEGAEKSGKRLVLAGFEILSRVGTGGMGSVYKARQISMDRIIALKILKPQLTQSKNFVKRFIREARAAARLSHPNIVQGFDVGESNGYYYFAMEFVDGETVHRIITRDGIMDEKRGLRICLDVSRALDHAYTYGLVHRDIKPGNIMVNRENVTKVCDLGLAQDIDEVSTDKQSRRFTVGTPYYISPEQATGTGTADTRSDTYSLGATLFRMVCGRVVYDGPTAAEILHKHVHEPVPWPKDFNKELTDNTCFVLMKMLAKDPKDRYQEPAELIADLRRVLAGQAPSAASLQIQVPGAAVQTAEREIEEADIDAAVMAEMKRKALESFLVVRKAMDKVATEQGVTKKTVHRLLRGNLDETRPETFLKYGVISLADGLYRQARADFRAAAKLGADVNAFIDKIDMLGAPLGMVLIPGGKFRYGDPDKAREEEVAGFYMDSCPVSNLEYKKFVDETGAASPATWKDGQIPEGQEDWPVVQVTWDEATAYAAWAKKRLPTEIEWEKAARGIDGRIYPWGNDFDVERCNVEESGIGRLVPVTDMPRGASPYGCLHMAGNARNWTATESPAPAGMTGDFRIVRGGSFGDPAVSARTFVREIMDRNTRSRRCGFRCAMDL